MEKPKVPMSFAKLATQEQRKQEEKHIEQYHEMQDITHVGLSSSCLIDWPPESMISCTAMVTPAAIDVHLSQQDHVPIIEWRHPLRCSGCYCFVNPFFSYSKNGKEFQCNICRTFVEVLPDDYSPLGVDGLPIDKENRPYLTSSVYKFKVSEEYSSTRRAQNEGNESLAAQYLFILDCSSEAVELGIPRITSKKITSWIRDIKHPARIGIILINDHVNLLVKHADSTKPHIMTLTKHCSFIPELPVPISQVMIHRSDYSDEFLDHLSNLAHGIHDRASPNATLESIAWSLELSIK